MRQKAPKSQSTADTSRDVRLTIDVVSGDALPVSWAEIEVDVVSESGAVRRHSATADGDGRAVVAVAQSDEPLWYSVSVGGRGSAFGSAFTDQRVVVEL
mgnify:CR=1 FL=1